MRRLLLLVVLVSACAHRPPTAAPDLGAPGVVQLEGARIRGEADPLTGLSIYDDEQLFDLAVQATRDEDWRRGRALYRRLLAEFPTSPRATPSRWNDALCSEKLGELPEAVRGYLDYADATAASEPPEAAVARVRAALLLQRLERHAESFAPLKAALRVTDLDREVAWQARILLAMTEATSGQFERAEDKLDRVRREVRRAARHEGETYPYTAAMVWYFAGDLYRRRARAEAFVELDDPEALSAVLDRKAQLLLEARHHFKRTLRHRIPQWSGPASLGLGQVYEDFHHDLNAAPLPPDLRERPEAAEVYREVLAERTRRFLERAAEDYREVLDKAGQLQLEPAWVHAVQRALAGCEEQLGVANRAQLMEPSNEPSAN